MFIRLLKARIKILLRERDLPFWGIIFPFFLISFLYLGTMGKEETLNTTYQMADIGRENYIQQRLLDVTGRAHGLTYFLAVVSISFMFMGFMGNREMEDQISWLSARGIRNSVAPMSERLFFVSGLCASWGLANAYIFSLLIYMKMVLGLGLKGELVGWGLIVALCTLGGILIGMIIGVLSKAKRSIKQGEIAVFGVGLGVIAGLVDIRAKFYIDAYFPIIAKINPTSIMVEGMFTLSHYGMNERFWSSIEALSIMDIVCLIILRLLIRRKHI